MIHAQFTRVMVTSTLMLSSFFGAAFGQTTAERESAATEESVSSEQILPKDTYLYFSLPGVQDMKEAFAASSTGRLWADPAFDDFKEEINKAFGSEISESQSKIQEALGLTLEELLNIPSGEVTLAVSAAPGKKLGAVLFVDYGESESAVQGLLQKATEALSASEGLEPANTVYDGTELTMFKVKGEIAKKTPLAKEFGWFMKDHRLVASNSSAVLQMVLNNWDGSAKGTLYENPVYSYIMEKCGGDEDNEEVTDLIIMYMDPIGLFTKIIETGSAGEAGMGASVALGFLPTLGLNQLKAFGAVGQTGVENFEGISRSFIYTEQPPAGAMRVFMLDQVDQTPPEWVKEGASMYMATKWQAGEAYDAIEALFDMFQGAGALAAVIEDLAGKGPQVHIKNDVIDLLDGNVRMVSAPAAESSTAAGDQMLFAIGVRDTDKAVDLLTKLTSEDDFPGTTREFQGVTVHEIEPGNGQKISFTVARNMLLIGVGDTILEQVLRDDSDLKPLAETDDFKAVAEHFPAGALAVTFNHPASQYRSLYEMLKSGKAAENFPGMDDFFQRIDFSRLPSFDVIEKYMAPAGGSWIGDENGVLMQQFSLTPEK